MTEKKETTRGGGAPRAAGSPKAVPAPREPASIATGTPPAPAPDAPPFAPVVTGGGAKSSHEIATAPYHERANKPEQDPEGSPGEPPLASARLAPRDGGDDLPVAEQGAQPPRNAPLNQVLAPARGPTDPAGATVVPRVDRSKKET